MTTPHHDRAATDPHEPSETHTMTLDKHTPTTKFGILADIETLAGQRADLDREIDILSRAAVVAGVSIKDLSEALGLSRFVVRRRYYTSR